jgi:CHAD domain-containing protein
MIELSLPGPDSSGYPTLRTGAGGSLAQEVQRVSLSLLAYTIAELRPVTPEAFDDGVHAARKQMKRLRGMLRLVRDEIGYRSYREENVVLRDTARSLAAVRDAWVSVAAVRSLRESYTDLLDPDTFAAPQAWLLERHWERRRSVTQSILNNAICNLGSATHRFNAYPIKDVVRNDFAALAPGLGRVYRRGRRAMVRSGKTGSVEDLHEWRKRVKYLRYQMEALSPMYPRLLRATAKSLDDLGETLGDDHDLAMLADTIMAHPESCRDERERWMLIALIHERRGNLRARAFAHGTALYGERPDVFVDRIGSYWKAGHR